MKNNPILGTDYPDVDAIRVGDTYYMISTTMHFMPGGVILRSYDLIHWEIITYVYDTLDDTPAQCLQDNQCIYGQGMWAASLRYHKGKFYVCFVANDTHKTYLYQAEDIKGPWKKSIVEGFYHDCSLLFDDDDRIYIVYGNRDIFLTELKADLSGPKPDGLHRLLISDTENVILGYEGAHIYKINGKYYIFFIHWLADQNKRRVEACFVSDSLTGNFTGRNILDDDMGHHNAGVAQGGIIDTPEGDWYAILFQDYGAVGRIPVLVPMRWENDFPVLGVDGKIPQEILINSTRPNHSYEPLAQSDDFHYLPDTDGRVHLKNVWQWNHIPDHALWSVTEKPGAYRIKSGSICNNVVSAVNTLTQRMTLPSCEASVTIDGSALRNGDYAGICALLGCYGLIALTKEAEQYYLVMLAKEPGDPHSMGKPLDMEFGKEYARVPVENSEIRLKIHANLQDRIDEVEFYYQNKDEWKKLGITHKIYFQLDHFAGCRFGLFMFSTKQVGGVADFKNFYYTCFK